MRALFQPHAGGAEWSTALNARAGGMHASHVGS
jgi:hypothetical protein